MEKITAGQTGAFAHVYLRSFSFFKNFVTMAGGHLPGERDLQTNWQLKNAVVLSAAAVGVQLPL